MTCAIEHRSIQFATDEGRELSLLAMTIFSGRFSTS
jgi:hypothetical protein